MLNVPSIRPVGSSQTGRGGKRVAGRYNAFKPADPQNQ